MVFTISTYNSKNYLIDCLQKKTRRRLLDTLKTLKNLQEIFDHPVEFWPQFLAFCCRQTMASRGCLLINKTAEWRQFHQFSMDQRRFDFSAEINEALSRLADQCLQDGWAFAQIKETQVTILAITISDLEFPTVAIFLLDDSAAKTKDESLQRLQLLSNVPASYHRQRAAQATEHNLSSLIDTLDLLLLLNKDEHFVAATMTITNEIAARYQCSRVNIGWLESGYIKLQAISHMENFERKMDIVSTLEAAMEEAFDQDEEILLPQPASSTFVSRDHTVYAAAQNIKSLISLPLRHKNQPLAILLCERANHPFGEDEIRRLRMLGDQIAPRLVTLKETDRWIGGIIAGRFRKWAAGLLGVEQTFGKISVLLICLLLVLSFIFQIPYRVEAPFILRSENVQQIAAPFEGYIEDVHVKIGQQVTVEQRLLSLDSRDLQLEESAALANQIRFLREAEKARAFGSLIDMKIAQAQADQAQAQLELIRYKLGQAEIKSSIDGIIVEGDLEELRGAPVNKGDVLFKVARHENLFIELKIDERNIHVIKTGQVGEIALVSQPEIKYPLRIKQIDPAAQADETGNYFLTRASSSDKTQSWWRPGMSGVAKVDVGNRSVIWILTHRTLDFFQMLIWW